MYHCISSHDQQGVSDTAFVPLNAVSFNFIPQPTESEWHWIFSSHIVTLHLIFGLAESGWHCILFSPYSYIAFHPMTNRKWVTLNYFFVTMQSHSVTQLVREIFLKYHLITSHNVANTWSIGCQCCYSYLYLQFWSFLMLNNQQEVSDNLIVLKIKTFLNQQRVSYVLFENMFTSHIVCHRM